MFKKTNLCLKRYNNSFRHWHLCIVQTVHVHVVVNQQLWTAIKKASLSFEGNRHARKNWRKKRRASWIPTDARPFLFLFRIVLFLASQPLADSSICRLLSQPVLLCQTACMANLRQYSRLQIGDSHAHSVETPKQTKHYGYYYVQKQKTFSIQIYVII